MSYARKARTAVSAFRTFAARHLLWLCGALTAFLAIAPVERALFRQQLNYNEGWNVFNALALSNHQLLYPPHYDWVTNNYPMLSFVMLEQLHRVTHDYLFTGRALAQFSTLLLAVFTALVAHTLGATRRAALLTGLFCFALFAANTAAWYVAALYTDADDPQMFGLATFMLGLLLCLKSNQRHSLLWLISSALVFVVAGSIKHNGADFALAVALDLFLLSRRRFLVFTVAALSFATVSVMLQVHFGGPWFIQHLTAPRIYAPLRKTFDQFVGIFLPILPHFLIGFAAVILRCTSSPRRLVIFLFCMALLLGLWFGSAQGVSVNCLFSVMLAMTLALGLLFSDLQSAPAGTRVAAWAELLPLALFALLLVPAAISGSLKPFEVWREGSAQQRLFDDDAAFLKARSGAALCEDLLQCFYADKPYLYDPFNATRLIRLHKLDPVPLLRDIQQHRFSSIELDDPAPVEYSNHSERFDAVILAAIQQNYRIARQRTGEIIYVPQPGSPSIASPSQAARSSALATTSRSSKQESTRWATAR